MHDIKAIRDNPEAFDAGLKRRGLVPLSPGLLKLDEERRGFIATREASESFRNQASKQIGMAMAQKDMPKAESLKAEVARHKDIITACESGVKEAEASLEAMLATIPNIPLLEVPEGADEHGNVVYKTHGSVNPRAADAPELPQHFDLGEALGLMDFEAATRMSGSRFVVIKGALARLERSLGQFMLDTHTAAHGYMEVNPPIIVREHAMYGTAQLPKFEDDQFLVSSGEGSAEKANRQWLIPTAEVPLTNLVREAIVAEEELPLRFTALTPCFRAEAGSAGRDTRGMLRQHQFNKVELVSITTPEQSRDEHERMLNAAENILKKLDLKYRVMTLCTGDMGFASQKTYDIEVWMPGQNTYREISSCSTCGDFQARRMNARFRPRDGKGTRFLHTLNGSGVAVGRALIAVMENFQNADGSLEIPEVLRPYMGGLKRIEKN